jgi:signal transduction histidine kinase
MRMAVAESLAASALRSGCQERFDPIPSEFFAARELGARTAIVTPMVFRDRPVGFLVVTDRLHSDRPFNEEDERLLLAFAASAAVAVATAQNASDDALRRGIEASEAERTRWARELHDETLQQLAGLRVLLSGARRSGEAERMSGAIETALEQITTAIGDLRSLITELRPAALDELGAKPALETLVERVTRQTDLEIDLDVDLAYENGESTERHPMEIESTIDRLVQEALTNIGKHAHATRVQVDVSDRDGLISVSVRDDGDGFEVGIRTAGFGLVGMRERLALVHGTLEIETAPGGGTTVRASIPIRLGSPEPRANGAQPEVTGYAPPARSTARGERPAR